MKVEFLKKLQLRPTSSCRIYFSSPFRIASSMKTKQLRSSQWGEWRVSLKSELSWNIQCSAIRGYTWVKWCPYVPHYDTGPSHISTLCPVVPIIKLNSSFSLVFLGNSFDHSKRAYIVLFWNYFMYTYFQIIFKNVQT